MIEPALTLAERYELGPVIGRGGMAEVRAGRDIRLERPVAVKLLRTELAHQREVRARFEAEARLAARLSHPNVVAVYDSGEVEGVPYIVMERLPGDTLHDRLAAGPMRPDDVADLAAQVLAALETAHAAGVLHRDIKPGNILAGSPGQWKVGDFGIAKALEADSSDGGDMTATGLLIGTPAYLAPERFFGAPATVASDLYSLAVVLYEALAGTKPFRTSRPDAWASLVAGTEPPPLSSVRPGIDPALEAAIMRGMAKDPADRYWSAGGMAAAIAEARYGGPGNAAAGQETLAGAGQETLAGAGQETLAGAGPAAAGGETVDWPPLDPAAAAQPTAVLGRSAPATDVLPVAERPYREPGRTGAFPGRGGALPGRRPFDGGLRTRMAVAAAVALVVIIGLAIALSGSHHSGSTTTPTTTARPASTATAPAGTAPAAPAAPAGTTGTVPPALGKALHNLLQQVKR